MVGRKTTDATTKTTLIGRRLNLEPAANKLVAALNAKLAEPKVAHVQPFGVAARFGAGTNEAPWDLHGSRIHLGKAE